MRAAGSISLGSYDVRLHHRSPTGNSGEDERYMKGSREHLSLPKRRPAQVPVVAGEVPLLDWKLGVCIERAHERAERGHANVALETELLRDCDQPRSAHHAE